MMWILTVLAAILAGELALRLPLSSTLSSILTTARRSARVLASRRVSDRWKEKALPAYALRMGLGSLRFLALLLTLLVPFLLAGLLAPGGLAAWSAELVRPLAMALACLASVAWVLLRLRLARHG